MERGRRLCRCCILKVKGVTTNNNPKNNPRRNSFTQPELPQLFDFITRLTQGERSISATSISKRVASVFKKKKGLKGLSSSSHVSPLRPHTCRTRLQPARHSRNKGRAAPRFTRAGRC